MCFNSYLLCFFICCLCPPCTNMHTLIHTDLQPWSEVVSRCMQFMLALAKVSLATVAPCDFLSQNPGISLHFRAEGRASVSDSHTHTYTHWGAWGRASNWATSQGSWTNYIVRINVALAMHGLWYLTAGAKKKSPPFPCLLLSPVCPGVF